jgi:hypothetical protein
MTQSTPTTLKRNPSLYDNIPSLDCWYECKNARLNEVVPCGVAKKRKQQISCNTVSFSAAPPAVYHYEDKHENPERPAHRRNSSSEQGKKCLFILYNA